MTHVKLDIDGNFLLLDTFSYSFLSHWAYRRIADNLLYYLIIA